MQTFYVGVAIFLVIVLLAALVRVGLGPEPPDRMLAAQLLGSSGAGVFFLLAEAMQQPVLRDVALLFALLAVLAVVAFVERPGASDAAEEGDRREGGTPS
jgi:multicomponent Na+:H+ antiporter subunit F